MAGMTYERILADERLAFAASIINAAYASDALDRLGIQKPGADRYYLPVTIDYLCGSENRRARRVFGAVHTAEFKVAADTSDPAYQASPYAGEIEFMRTLRPGDVAVIATPSDKPQASDAENEMRNGGVWGGLLTALAMSYGALGAVIEGPIRDCDQINGYFRDEPFDERSRRSLEHALGAAASDDNVARVRAAMLAREAFPVYGTGTQPTDSAYRTEAVSSGEPIVIDGAAIVDRDFIVADMDGQVVIPNGAVVDVLEKVIEIDEGDKGVWSDALARLAGFHDDSIDDIIERNGGHL
jgi:regulator of RNase E activity RraA